MELADRDAPFDLLVIDTAVRFLPLGERNKKTQAWALAQLSLSVHFDWKLARYDLRASRANRSAAPRKPSTVSNSPMTTDARAAAATASCSASSCVIT